MTKRIYCFLALFCINLLAICQEADTLKQKDIIDVMESIFPKHKFKKHSEESLTSGSKFIWLSPNVGYSLTTGFLTQVVGNIAYRKPNANVSTIVPLITYTQKNQLVFEMRTNHWFKDNRFNLVGDWRVMRYPQNTYGLGTNSMLDDVINMDYNHLRLHQTVLKKVYRNVYVGLGYLLDYHWNIISHTANQELTIISNYQNGVSGSSTSSGLLLSFLYDNRLNSINPTAGLYLNLTLRNNFRWLGSNENTEMLMIDLRKYVHLPQNSDNVLAFWSYNSLTVSGNPPFLDLSSTGWDTYGNTGRGFIQGRFRGKKMIYAETEYRFGITKNRLLGGVFFINAQTLQGPILGGFDRIMTAAGGGLRIKLNKFSRANFAIDYAFGADGSNGLFFNVGEVF